MIEDLFSAPESLIVDAWMAGENLGAYRFNKLVEAGYTDREAIEHLQTHAGLEDQQAQLTYWHDLLRDNR